MRHLDTMSYQNPTSDAQSHNESGSRSPETARSIRALRRVRHDQNDTTLVAASDAISEISGDLPPASGGEKFRYRGVETFETRTDTRNASCPSEMGATRVRNAIRPLRTTCTLSEIEFGRSDCSDDATSENRFSGAQTSEYAARPR